MAIKFFNIRSKEVRTAETEPLIAALWASSDHSPNVSQGQDFGWRLAPEVVVEMRRLKADFSELERVARFAGRSVDEVGEIELLHYISNHTSAEDAAVAGDEDYTDEYNAEIRRLERQQNGTPETIDTTTTLSTEELEAELARRKAAEAPATTTTTTKK